MRSCCHLRWRARPTRTSRRRHRHSSLSSLARLGVLGATVPVGGIAALFAQARGAETWGKEKLLARSVRPPDYETPEKIEERLRKDMNLPVRTP